eukprot:gene9913-1789_t
MFPSGQQQAASARGSAISRDTVHLNPQRLRPRATSVAEGLGVRAWVAQVAECAQMSVEGWLNGQGLGEYADAFAEQGFSDVQDIQYFIENDPDTFKALGVLVPGISRQRRRRQPANSCPPHIVPKPGHQARFRRLCTGAVNSRASSMSRGGHSSARSSSQPSHNRTSSQARYVRSMADAHYDVLRDEPTENGPESYSNHRARRRAQRLGLYAPHNGNLDMHGEDIIPPRPAQVRSRSGSRSYRPSFSAQHSTPQSRKAGNFYDYHRVTGTAYQRSMNYYGDNDTAPDYAASKYPTKHYLPGSPTPKSKQFLMLDRLPTIEELFHFFCTFGDKDNRGLMNEFKFMKFVRWMNLLDDYLTVTDVDLIFIKALGLVNSHTHEPRYSKLKHLDLQTFDDALKMMALVKFPDLPPKDAGASLKQAIDASAPNVPASILLIGISEWGTVVQMARSHMPESYNHGHRQQAIHH